MKSSRIYLFGWSYFKLLVILTSIVFICDPLTAENLEINIQKVDVLPKIDGFIEQAFWGNITPLTGFVQFDPYNGEPPSEQTIVYLAYDEDNLYVAFDCLDSQPEKIKGDLTPRDMITQGINDDFFVLLDTFYDKRNAYYFVLNPMGIQVDFPGDYLWKSAAVINENGWSGEMQIPFKSIRFPTEGDKPWGINFGRYLFRSKERSHLSHVGRDDVELEKSAVLRGLEGIKGGKNMEFFPYSGYRNSVSGEEKDSKFAMGIDAKYSITSNLNLDTTVSPDFSEVESDPFFYQLTPYEFFIREKRPFFQEAERYLGEDLFYTRRVSNPRFAFKLTGKEAGYTIGILGALNKDEDVDQYLGVCRVKKDIFKLSELAFSYSGHKTPGFTNHNGEVDLNLRFSRSTTIQATSKFSHNSDIERRNNLHHYLRFSHFPDEGLAFHTSFRRIEENYRPRAGYQPYRDYQYFHIMPGYSKRINKYGFKKIDYLCGVYFRQNTTGQNIGYTVTPLDLGITSMKELWIYLYSSFGRKRAQFYGDDDLEWTKNYFKTFNLVAEAGYEGSRFYSFELRTWYSYEPVYNDSYTEVYDGKSISIKSELEFKPTSFINLAVNLEFTRQTMRATGEELFEGLLSSANIRYQISRQVFMSSYLQHDSHYKRVNIDLLLGIELGMGNLFSVSYKRFTPLEGSPYEESARSFVVKASYLLRL